MRTRATPYLQAIWVGVAVQIAGRILDGIWHANHEEFEGTSEQLEAHWLLWIGVLITLVAVALVFVRLPASERNAGYTITLAGLLLYVPVSVWHFVEHANRADPELAHVLLAVGQVAIIAGAIIAALLARRARRAEPAPG